MDALVELQILSLGNNKLENLSDVSLNHFYFTSVNLIMS